MLKYSEPKLLFSKKELDRILSLNTPSPPPLTSDILVEKKNVDFASQRNLNKIDVDEKWSKLNKRLSPLVTPLTSAASTVPSTPPLITNNDDDDEDNEDDQRDVTASPNEIVDHVEQYMPRSMVNRALLLCNIFLKHPEIRITKKKIYVNGDPLPSSTINVLRHLVGPYKDLHYDLTPLFQVLSTAYDDQLIRLIGNKQGKKLLQKSSSELGSPIGSSTPIRQKEPSSTIQSLNESSSFNSALSDNDSEMTLMDREKRETRGSGTQSTQPVSRGLFDPATLNMLRSPRRKNVKWDSLFS